MQKRSRYTYTKVSGAAGPGAPSPEAPPAPPYHQYHQGVLHGFLHASLQAHIQRRGPVRELVCTRLKTRHEGYSSFHVTAADDEMEKLFDPLLWPEGSLFKEFKGQLTDSRTYQAHQNVEKIRYDARHRYVTYNDGDLVWIWMPIKKPVLSSKLLRRYHCPYKVLTATSPVNYRVEPVPLPTDRRRHHQETVHVSRMKPYVPPDPTAPSTTTAARMAAP
ncbi:hypothetical protein HPB47_015116 [Ixodes persulcatus]|uniref:Uncharacterized protein n=1 Tax=Ixodes persulcatus TaxID=34615 RepID=A0AC60QXV4_IXOPE|nr:hypothetical protein HPB47_015116 [Ixodes persulcatus]